MDIDVIILFAVGMVSPLIRCELLFHEWPEPIVVTGGESARNGLFNKSSRVAGVPIGTLSAAILSIPL